MSLSKLAMTEERYQSALDCAAKANAHIRGEHRADILYQLAYCLRKQPEPVWDERLPATVRRSTSRPHPEQAAARAKTLIWLAYCLYSQPEPAWVEAITCSRQVLELLTALEHTATGLMPCSYSPTAYSANRSRPGPRRLPATAKRSSC